MAALAPGRQRFSVPLALVTRKGRRQSLIVEQFIEALMQT